jgi:hypothetical protein
VLLEEEMAQGASTASARVTTSDSSSRAQPLVRRATESSPTADKPKLYLTMLNLAFAYADQG